VGGGEGGKRNAGKEIRIVGPLKVKKVSPQSRKEGGAESISLFFGRWKPKGGAAPYSRQALYTAQKVAHLRLQKRGGAAGGGGETI